MLSDFIKDKAREISYALIRVSFYVKRQDFRSRLESLAVELLEDSARASADANLNNINRTLADISSLDALVRLAHSIYEIEPVNATILVRELDSLDSAIRSRCDIGIPTSLPEDFNSASGQYGNAVKPHQDNSAMRQSLNIEEFFSKADSETDKSNSISPISPSDNPNGNSINAAIRSRRKVGIPTSLSNDMNEASGQSGNENGIGIAIRQSAIINKIRSGNDDGCRLKDLTAEFPDVSERTLRYDLSKLCEQGIIERVGNGGPASHYRFGNRDKAISL